VSKTIRLVSDASGTVPPSLICIMLAFIVSVSCLAQNSPKHPNWPGPGQLFVGTCYQPIDRSPEQIDRDIAIMKRAGFNVVRMGDLSWDSFEPFQGKFDFEWFDKIMDKMQASGIRVIVDIPGLPAPIWLHRTYPGVDVVTQNGTRLPPAERYMDDISDPNYVREAGILADRITNRYAHHPDARKGTIAVIRNYRKDGTMFWNELALSPIRDRHGEVTHWVGIQNDVSVRVTVEEALRESEKLAASGRLAASIAHEINNPLDAVMNLIYLARQVPGDGRRDQYLEEADKELRRVAHLTAPVTSVLQAIEQATGCASC
jgi:Beta-galactosidase/His Kinase A (phospho-acceptor) domain/PAS domain